MKFLDASLNGITFGAVYAAVALTLVLIWRSTRILNFAQGAMLTVTTYVGWTVQQHSQSYWLSLLAALATGLVLGAVVERGIVRLVEQRPPLNAVIVTLGLLVLFTAGVAMIWPNRGQRPYVPAFDVVGYTKGLGFGPNDLYTVLAVVVVMALLIALFRFTNLGLRMRAAAFSPEVSRLLGVRVGRLLTLGWALATALGALAGVLAAGQVNTVYNNLTPHAFDALLIYGFTAAIIGGLDSPAGAVVGGLLLGLALSYATAYIGGDTPVEFFAFVILVAVLMARPNGLFAATATRRV